MVFVARHLDVVEVLRDEARFSVSHYAPLYAAAPHGAILLMLPKESQEHKDRYAILEAAMKETPWFTPEALRYLARQCVADLTAAFRARPGGQFDLIGEFGYFAPYLIARGVFGLPGPRTSGLLPRLVCSGVKFTPETTPYLTQFAWSQLVFAQLFGNFERRLVPLTWLAGYSAGKLTAHIKSQLRRMGPGAPAHPTLLWALNSQTVRAQFPHLEKVYDEHIISLIIELVGTAQLIPGLGFSAIIDRWEQDGAGLVGPLAALTPESLDNFVDESLRLSPPDVFLLRNARGATRIGDFDIREGEYVCALVAKAGRDSAAIDRPDEVILSRDQDLYVHFGPLGGPHRCFGRLIAHAMLGEMLLGLKDLAGLESTSKMSSPLMGPAKMMVRFDREAEASGRTPADLAEVDG
jgi:cytochrome P450